MNTTTQEQSRERRDVQEHELPIVKVDFVRWLLQLIVSRLPAPRVIWDREGGSKYLSRWYLIGTQPEEDNLLKGQSVEPEKRERFQLYIHRFHRSDDDGALHSHPWRWAVSLMLAGGYWEDRRVGDAVVRRLVRPWRFNFLRGENKRQLPEDFHRVDLIEHDAWSLFFVGPKASGWFFWDRIKLMRSPWRDFVKVKRGQATDAKWQRDSRAESEVR